MNDQNHLIKEQQSNHIIIIKKKKNQQITQKVINVKSTSSEKHTSIDSIDISLSPVSPTTFKPTDNTELELSAIDRRNPEQGSKSKTRKNKVVISPMEKMKIWDMFEVTDTEQENVL